MRVEECEKMADSLRGENRGAQRPLAAPPRPAPACFGVQYQSDRTPVG